LDLDFEYTLNILQYEFKDPYFSYNFFKILPTKHLWHPIFGLTYISKTTHNDPPKIQINYKYIQNFKYIQVHSNIVKYMENTFEIHSNTFKYTINISKDAINILLIHVKYSQMY
jgi:hypothetical protein